MKKKRNPIVVFVLIILGLSVTAEILKLIFNEEPFDKQMMTMASDVNRSCPIMVDSVTRLNNTVTLPNNEFQFNYSFIKSSKNEIDTASLKERMHSYITNYLKTNPLFNKFKENNVTLKENFTDSAGNYVCSILITPDQYK